ncbi:hypothetical protein [Streptomyces sp. NPDC093269]|uniref:hypothetical protein n=1 Tax=Streptomyces sp. NPDC093269 TaxID=3366038 RepID=UPI00381B9B2E
MLPIVFATSAWAFLICSFAGYATKRISRLHYNALLVISNTLFGIGYALSGRSFAVCVHAALAAFSAWMWWHDGGGDGTKRRLKKWASRFQGVRRTAPSHA